MQSQASISTSRRTGIMSNIPAADKLPKLVTEPRAVATGRTGAQSSRLLNLQLRRTQKQSGRLRTQPVATARGSVTNVRHSPFYNHLEKIVTEFTVILSLYRVRPEQEFL